MQAGGLPTLTLRSVRGWLIAFSSFGINVLTMMTYTSYPVMYQPLIDKYDSDRMTIGLTFSILCLTGDVAGILCSPFIKYCGCRRVAFVGMLMKTISYALSAWPHSVAAFHFTFGLIGGIGLGTSRLAAMCVIQEAFAERRDFMTRLTTIGYYVGDAIGPIVANHALRWSGLSGTLMILAQLQAQGIVLAMLYPVRREESSKSNLRQTMGKFWQDLTDLTILRNLEFVVICIIRFAWSSCRYTLLIHIVNVAHLLGMSPDKANQLPALMSITGIAIGVLNTVLVRWINPRIGFILGVFCAASGCFLVIYGNCYTLVAAMVLLGCDEGMSFSTLCILLVDVVGEDRFARALSLTDVAQIPAHFVSGPLAGWLADFTGSYRASYTIGCIMGLIAIMLAIGTYFMDKRSSYESLTPTGNTESLSKSGQYEELKQSAYNTADVTIELHQRTA